MKAVILAGGFAKRLGELGKNMPKALLPVADTPIIEHILRMIEPITQIDQIFISTNKRFEEHFKQWLNGIDNSKIDLIVEPAMEEGQKLGSIGALQFLIEQKNIDDDLLVINGDNMFDLNLRDFINFYNERGSFSFCVYDTHNINEARKMGVVLLDQNDVVMDFEEKPENPKSTKVSTGIYIFPRNNLPMIKQYIDEGNTPDRPGDLLIWMMKKQKLNAFSFEGKWFDIGSTETYEQAQKEYAKEITSKRF